MVRQIINDKTGREEFLPSCFFKPQGKNPGLFKLLG